MNYLQEHSIKVKSKQIYCTTKFCSNPGTYYLSYDTVYTAILIKNGIRKNNNRMATQIANIWSQMTAILVLLPNYCLKIVWNRIYINT